MPTRTFRGGNTAGYPAEMYMGDVFQGWQPGDSSCPREIVMFLIHFHPSHCRDFKIHDTGLPAGISCRIEDRLWDAELLKPLFCMGQWCSLALSPFLHGLNRDGIPYWDKKRQPLFRCHAQYKQTKRIGNRQAHGVKCFCCLCFGIAINPSAYNGVVAHFDASHFFPPVPAQTERRFHPLWRETSPRVGRDQLPL